MLDVDAVHPSVLLAAAAPVLKVLAAERGFDRRAVFGSVARGEAGSGSDIDLLVEAPSGTSSMAFLRFKGLVDQVLGREVDLVDYGGLIDGWLSRVAEIVTRGELSYRADALLLLQGAGDSLMMKLGEAANRLSRLGVLAPKGVDRAPAVANRNFIIHQYDQIIRE